MATGILRISGPRNRAKCEMRQSPPVFVREPADRGRPPEDEHGQRREAGGRKPGLPVDPADAPQHVNRRGMQPLGHLATIRCFLA